MLTFSQLLTSGTANNEVMLKGFNSICDIQLYWNTCEKTYFQLSRRENYKNLLEPLAKLYSHIFEYQARVICHLSRAQLSRTWQNVAHGNDWDEKEREVNELDDRCRHYINHFDAEQFKKDRDIQLQEMQGSRSILDRIRMILDAGSKETKRIYEDQKERDLLRDLASDYEDYKDFNPQKVDGTCEWFFMDNRFRKWRDSNTSNLLWVSAGPGCGKSVLSRALIDERRLSTSVTTSTVCYFFFKDGYQGRMDATNALCAILHQLFMYSPADGLIGRALPSHKSYGNGLASNFSELWRILLDCADSSEAGEIVCVLDALDECNADSKQQLIGKLNQFYCRPRNSPSKLKFLITSRPYDDIEASFKGFPDTNAYLHFDGDGKSSQISKEINLVIDAKVNEIARNFEENDRKRISDQLKSIEHRTYLWLHLTFEIIKESPSEYSRRSDIETLLSGLPAKVSEAYEKILDRSKNQDHTATLLQIILAAARPLTLDEANIALTLALEKQRFDSHASLVSKMWPRHLFESTVKNLCGLFISVYESKLSFIHQTAREFLIHPQRERKWQGRFNVSDAHGKMSLVCLEYLTYIDAQDIPIKKLKVKFPLAQYSARYWMDHARPVESEEEVQKSISDFFLQREHAYMTWGKLFDPDNLFDDESGQRSTPIPLYYASLAGFQCVVDKLLLQEGMDANAQGGHYHNALQAASAKGYQGIVHLLLEKGADINAQGGLYGNALQAASVKGHQQIVQLLLEKGADTNAQGGQYGSALQAASYWGHQQIVQLLLEKGADTNAQGGLHRSALQAASYRGHQQIVQFLLEKGADINAQGGQYGNALQAASAKGYQGIIQLLLEHMVRLFSD